MTRAEVGAVAALHSGLLWVGLWSALAAAAVRRSSFRVLATELGAGEDTVAAMARHTRLLFGLSAALALAALAGVVVVFRTRWADRAMPRLGLPVAVGVVLGAVLVAPFVAFVCFSAVAAVSRGL